MLNLASTGQYRLSNQVIACKGRIEARVHLPHIPTRQNYAYCFGDITIVILDGLKRSARILPLSISDVLIPYLMALKASVIFVKSLSICLHHLYFNGHKELITSCLFLWDGNILA